MIGITTRLVYVEFADSEGPEEAFAWYDGKVLAADQHAERAQLDRELLDIVKRAEFDKAAEWGRAVRCEDRLLVEVEVLPATGSAQRLTATIVITVARPDSDWVGEAATEIAAMLRGEGLNVAADRLAQAFTEGWSRKRPFPIQRAAMAFAAAGSALAIASWIRSAGRKRRQRQSKASKVQG